ncbi:MAG TPA: FAD-dependent oxidoreductase [Chloroflexota bacterium]|nr:FAD-dependent oxidoreductase [Chloroflexota bacterium]
MSTTSVVGATPPAVELRSVRRSYALGGETIRALDGVDLVIRRGDFLSIVGPSGSGKSTLLNLIGCLDRPTEGTVFIDGQDVSRLRGGQLARIRREKIGFVFQQHNLVPVLTAEENVALPLRYAGVPRWARRERARAALEAVGLADRLRHRPSELSGGQQQRVAIARALVTQPAITLADEPTGALDSRTSAAVVALMRRLNRERGQTFVVVTHDPAVAEQTDRVVRLLDGRVEHDTAWVDGPVPHRYSKLSERRAFEAARSAVVRVESDRRSGEQEHSTMQSKQHVPERELPRSAARNPVTPASESAAGGQSRPTAPALGEPARSAVGTSTTAAGGTSTTAAVVGGGPAGVMLGLLLARAGVDVIVLEKHADFLRDFRGDTIHPATLEILDELGLADRFLQLPHAKSRRVEFQTADGQTMGVDFSRLRTRFPYVAFVPQWDFLEFLTAEAARYPTFRLIREAEVTGLIEEDGVVHGVRYHHGGVERELRAALTVGADGRHSVTRAAAGLPLVATSPLMDVLWFRLSRRPADLVGSIVRVGRGQMGVFIDRSAYWQIAYIIPKGGDARIRAAGLDAFRRSVAALVPELADRVDELREWEQVKLLSVRSDRLTRWYKPGYLAIGDAAHAMSPLGGVGINLAIQDAVVAANLLSGSLRQGQVSMRELAAVQRRRELPARVIQGLQGFMHKRLIERALTSDEPVGVPRVMRLILRTPVLRDLPARLIGFGIGRPHVTAPAVAMPTAGARAEAASRGARPHPSNLERAA